MADEPRFRLEYQDPFAARPEDRRGDRRLRGRLVAPVTIWTAGGPGRRAGLSVSSAMVAEGDPGVVMGLVGPLSAWLERVAETGLFTVQVLDEADRRLADGFAGSYPVDPFDGLEVADSPWGPILAGGRTTACCRLAERTPLGYHELVQGWIEDIHLSSPSRPLVRYRGAYRGLGPSR